MASGINATTPQLKLVKDYIDAYLTLNIKNVEPFVSKNYKFQSFPKVPDLPDQAKGEHSERYGTVLSLMNKMEVRDRTRFSFSSSSADRPPTARSIIMK